MLYDAAGDIVVTYWSFWSPSIASVRVVISAFIVGVPVSGLLALVVVSVLLLVTYVTCEATSACYGYHVVDLLTDEVTGFGSLLSGPV